AGEPRRVDVDVHANRRHGALGGFDANAVTGERAVAGGLFVAVVGLVVAQAHERTHRVVGSAEVVLAAERIRLAIDAGGLVAAGGDAIAGLVGAPGFDRDVVGDVPGGAERRRAFALGLGQVAVDDGIAGRLGERIATDHAEALAGCGVAGSVLCERSWREG